MATIVLVYCLWRLIEGEPTPTTKDRSSTNTSASPANAEAGLGTPSPPPSAGTKPRLEDFVGADACAGCHREQYDAWRSSTHGRAGGKPGDVTVLAKFDGRPLPFKDAIVTPRINAQGEYVFEVVLDGATPAEIKVAAAIGGGHMYGGGTQTFFQRFADGTVRFLPFDFIREENLWFVQLRVDKTWVPVSREVSFQTELENWPPHRVLGTAIEFSNCQNCHGSQVALRYDPAARRYDTRYESLAINCESCHGPGRRHVTLASQPGIEMVEDVGMASLQTLSKDASLAVCFQCHATKDAIRDDFYLPGESWENYFSIKLPFFGDNPYLSDGRIRSFGYQANHLFSDCYLNGSMTCVDCHDPHSQVYRDVFGKPLQGKFDNGQCIACHASKAQDLERHTHHKPDSQGSLCTSCHMPFLQHQGVGRHLKFARSDHSIPIPRPAFDQGLGIENACQKCHRDKDLTWQESHLAAWYGAIKPHHPMVAALIQSVTETNSSAAAALLLQPEARHPMAQMAGLASFVRRFLRPRMEQTNPVVVNPLKQYASGSDLDLKALALMSLQVSFGHEETLGTWLRAQLAGLTHPDDPVRNRWSVAAAYWGDTFAAQEDPGNAIYCYARSLEIQPRSVVTLSHLAVALMRVGDTTNAIGALREAIRIKPHQPVLHFQLAQVQAQLGNRDEAVRSLEEGLKHAPDDARARAMLEVLKP